MGEFPVPALAERARRCADALREADAVLVVSHIDADGLTSAAVASAALARAGVDHEVAFEKQLDEDRVAAVADADRETVLFTDFGSGQLDAIAARAERGDFRPVVADHHQPADADVPCHLNPLLAGIDGASDLSGAGATYLLARALGGASNRDLAALAVVGAVGDRQRGRDGLTGANAAIAAEGVEAGVLAEERDLALYGTQTRSLPKLLAYASDAALPGIAGNDDGARSFLADLDVACRDGDGEWRTWADLTHEERRTVVSALVRHAVSRGVPAGRIDELVATGYTLPEEEPGTELRDAGEFATLLNATARYERAGVGLAVCLGDRDEALAAARSLLARHRRNISAGLEWVREHGVTREDHVQWFHAGDAVRETIVGIVAGMAMGTDGADGDRPIVAFADTDEEEVKVSTRGTTALVRRGLDLSTAMTEAATAVGGEGGGHDVAAGASIPPGTEQDFVDAVDRIVGEQLA
ncbi:MAG: DHHA1 domain-containing protein [Halobacteriaceae archaeon]